MMLQTQRKAKIMTLNLARGHFNSINGHQVLKADFNDLVYPVGRYRFNILEYEKDLPPINEVYETAIKAGMTDDEIINLLIRMYFPLKFFRVGNYEDMVLCIGFLGPRGSGKSCSASMVGICDFLLRGKPLWSNMDLKVRVVYRDCEKVFESYPLDDLNLLDLSGDFGGGCIVYDEINLEAAESTRYSSGANLAFANVMQQIRKRALSIIYCCQGWSWLDSRLRWQSDFVVACRDATFEKNVKSDSSIGDSCVWRIHDLSGTSGHFDYDFELKHRYLTDYIISQHKVWLKPWWFSYSTEKLHGQNDYIQKYKDETKARRHAEADKLPEPIDNIMIVPETSNTITEYVEACRMQGVIDLPCKTVWRILGISENDRSAQTTIGSKFNKYYTRKRKGDGYHWILKEEYRQ